MAKNCPYRLAIKLAKIRNVKIALMVIRKGKKLKCQNGISVDGLGIFKQKKPLKKYQVVFIHHFRQFLT